MESECEMRDVKRDMMNLWKLIFQDSDEYISLVFDNYFNIDNVHTFYIGNRLIASLLGVPYKFKVSGRELSGLYLCGLATDPEYRKRGIMNSLIEEANASAKDAGYDMTFLIPADDNLKQYYLKRGYRFCSFRQQKTYYRREATSLDNCTHKFYLFSAGKLFSSKKEDEKDLQGNRILLEKLYNSIHNDELLKMNKNIVHTNKDLELVFKESHISGGWIFYSVDIDGQISAVCFVVETSPDVAVQHMFYVNEEIRSQMLDYVCKFYNRDKLVYYEMQETYMDLRKRVESFGMIRKLRENENRGFLADESEELKYSNLAELGNFDKIDDILKKDLKFYLMLE